MYPSEANQRICYKNSSKISKGTAIFNLNLASEMAWANAAIADAIKNRGSFPPEIGLPN
jgi:hypothetical protein